MFQDRLPARISRRAAFGVSAMALAAASAKAAPLDPQKPDDARLLYRKLRYRADNGLLFWWVKGPHFAEIGADLIPLYGACLGSIQRVVQRPDGGFDVRDLEFNFHTDTDTGKRLTSFRNPITNQTVAVAMPMPQPHTIHYSPNNEPHVSPIYGRSHLEVSHFPATSFVIGQNLFIRDRNRATVTTPGEPTRIVNELSTFSAPIDSALDPHVMSADTRLQSNDVSDWPHWLGMGARPGIMALYGVGGKARSFAEMPVDWLEMLHDFAPDVARDPIAALDRA